MVVGTTSKNSSLVLRTSLNSHTFLTFSTLAHNVILLSHLVTFSTISISHIDHLFLPFSPLSSVSHPTSCCQRGEGDLILGKSMHCYNDKLTRLQPLARFERMPLARYSTCALSQMKSIFRDINEM